MSNLLIDIHSQRVALLHSVAKPKNKTNGGLWCLSLVGIAVQVQRIDLRSRVHITYPVWFAKLQFGKLTALFIA